MKSHFLSDRKPERLGSHLHARCHALVLQQHFRREAHKATTLCEFLSRCVYRIWHAIRFLHGSATVCMLLSCSRSWCAELVHSKLNLWTAVLFHLSPPPPVSPSTCLPLHRWLFTHPLTDARNTSYIWFWFLLPCLWATWHFGVCLWMSVQLQVHRVAVLTDVSQMQSGRRVVLLCSGSVVLQGRLMLSAQLYWSAL